MPAGPFPWPLSEQPAPQRLPAAQLLTKTRIPNDRKRRWQPLMPPTNNRKAFNFDINFEHSISFEQARTYLFNFERCF